MSAWAEQTRRNARALRGESGRLRSGMLVRGAGRSAPNPDSPCGQPSSLPALRNDTPSRRAQPDRPARKVSSEARGDSARSISAVFASLALDVLEGVLPLHLADCVTQAHALRETLRKVLPAVADSLKPPGGADGSDKLLGGHSG